jgi:hypothetical protein
MQHAACAPSAHTAVHSRAAERRHERARARQNTLARTPAPCTSARTHSGRGREGEREDTRTRTGSDATFDLSLLTSVLLSQDQVVEEDVAWEYTHTHARARTHIRTHIRTRTYAQTHAHTHAHTHSHTHAHSHSGTTLCWQTCRWRCSLHYAPPAPQITVLTLLCVCVARAVLCPSTPRHREHEQCSAGGGQHRRGCVSVGRRR